MREHANAIYPFAIAVVFPPAGLLLGIAAVVQDDRDTGIRLLVVAAVAAVVWAFLLFA